MRITVKLFAVLANHLPAGARDNQVSLDVPAEATPASVMALLRLPAVRCHLVLVNGVFVSPGERDRRTLREGDVLALWPPVAGG